MQQAAADQADEALYMTSHAPSDSRHFADTLNKPSGNFHQQIRARQDPEYILPGAKIGNIHGQHRAGPSARAIHSFQRLVMRPHNSQGMLVNGSHLFLPFDSPNSPLKA